jgi:site-specific DNA-methyltransferase (adenine-specific)
MELMARYPDNYFELAIVDPPYKNDVSGLNAGINRNFSYNEFKAPNKEYINELFRVSKNQIMWGFNYYLELLPNTDSVICWFKHQNGHFSECEYAWSSIKKSRLFDRSYQQDQYNKIHPTQKPVALYKWILDKYAKQGDKILDTHLGSGSIAIACHDYGFDLTACELDKEYFDKAMERINNHTAQTKLF